jgi:hypothetical protein
MQQMTQQQLTDMEQRVAAKITQLLPVQWANGDIVQSIVRSVSAIVAEEMFALEAKLMAAADEEAKELNLPPPPAPLPDKPDSGVQVSVEGEGGGTGGGGSVSVTVPIPGT